jgi:hypothetical protein
MAANSRHPRLIRSPRRHVAGVQGIFYFITGIWPLLSISTFMAVTGPKTDIWLVKTVGVLLGVIGLTLILAAARRQMVFAVAVLGIGTALGLIGIELFYVFNGTISAVYLLDTILEAGFLIGWLSRPAAPPASSSGDRRF